MLATDVVVRSYPDCWVSTYIVVVQPALHLAGNRIKFLAPLSLKLIGHD